MGISIYLLGLDLFLPYLICKPSLAPASIIWVKSSSQNQNKEIREKKNTCMYTYVCWLANDLSNAFQNWLTMSFLWFEIFNEPLFCAKRPLPISLSVNSSTLYKSYLGKRLLFLSFYFYSLPDYIRYWIGSYFPMSPRVRPMRLAGWLVGRSVCHDFLTGREVTLLCSSRSTC